MKVKINFWIAIIILIGLVSFQTYIKDISIERTIYFILILLVTSWIITVASSNDINLIRKTRESRQQVGHYFSEKYEIINNKNLPIIWATIIDESNISKRTIIKIIAWILGHDHRDFLQRTFLENRGVFSLGPTKFITGDPFGFFEKSVTFNSFEKVVILPTYSKLDKFEDPTGFLSGGSAKKSRNTEVSPYAVSVRDYSPGDPLRRIDWKSTARLDKLMVKEFEEDPQSTVWIFVDCSSDYIFEDKKNSNSKKNDDFFLKRKEHNSEYWFKNSFEQEISIAASILDYYITNNRFVGFYTNSKRTLSISPEGGIRQLDKVLELLASLEPSSEQTLSSVILSQKNRLGNESTIVIITSTINDQFLETVKQLKQRKFTIITVVIDVNSYDDQKLDTDKLSSAESLGIKIFSIKNGHTINEYLQENTYISS